MNVLTILGLVVLISISDCRIVKREPPVSSSFDFSGFNSGLDLPNFYSNNKGSGPAISYGAPQPTVPPSQYGVPSHRPPSRPSPQYGAPSKPSQNYGVPHSSPKGRPTSHASQSYGFPSVSTVPTGPVNSYGPPPSGHFHMSLGGQHYFPALTHTSPPLTPSYGVPTIPNAYGAPSASTIKPSPQYGAPTQSLYNFGQTSHNFGGSLMQAFDANGGYVY